MSAPLDGFETTLAKRKAETAKERARSGELWRLLQASGDPQTWKERVANDPRLQSFALCEKLCHESAELAEDDPERALLLAELALELAPKVAGDKHLRAGMQQYAWTHLGNVLRARGDLKGAQAAIEKGQEFFLASIPPALTSQVLHGRLAPLESALLRDQGNLPEALRKIAEALRPGTDESIVPVLHLEAARLHRWLGRPEESLKELAYVGRTGPPPEARLLVRLELERGNALCDLGRHGDVEKLPARLRKKAEESPLDRARLHCLEGRIAVGLGRTEEAEAALRKARQDTDARAVTELALLSLEMAALYLRQGQTAGLKALAEEMSGLLEGPGLSREGAVSLKLFCRLAAQEKMSLERAMQFIKDFSRLPPPVTASGADDRVTR